MLARLSGTSRSLWRLGSLRCGVFGNFEWLTQTTNIPTQIITYTHNFTYVNHIISNSHHMFLKNYTGFTWRDCLKLMISSIVFLHGFFCKREHNRRELFINFIILELLDCLVCTFNISGHPVFFRGPIGHHGLTTMTFPGMHLSHPKFRSLGCSCKEGMTPLSDVMATWTWISVLLCGWRCDWLIYFGISPKYVFFLKNNCVFVSCVSCLNCLKVMGECHNWSQSSHHWKYVEQNVSGWGWNWTRSGWKVCPVMGDESFDSMCH